MIFSERKTYEFREQNLKANEFIKQFVCNKLEFFQKKLQQT